MAGLPKRKPFPDEVINYARDLYLEFDELGNRRYGTTIIAQRVAKKFNIKISDRTISSWSRRFSWNVLFKDARNRGFLKSINDLQESRDQVTLSLSNEFRNLYNGTISRFRDASKLVEAWLKENLKQLEKEKKNPKQFLDSIIDQASDLMRKDFEALLKIFFTGDGGGDAKNFNLFYVNNSDNSMTINITEKEKSEIAEQYGMIDKMVKMRKEIDNNNNNIKNEKIIN